MFCAKPLGWTSTSFAVQSVSFAVVAAEKAFRRWSRLSGAERGKYIYRIARLIQEKARELVDSVAVFKLPEAA